jgi:hypothetical protein
MILPKAARDDLGFEGDLMSSPVEDVTEKVLSDDEDAEAAAAQAIR